MFNTFKNLLPDLYSPLLSKELLNSSLSETKATCQNCLRSRDKRHGYLYKPDLKCCTFFPFLPNFAVGGILEMDLPGANVIKEFIQNRQFSLPIGLFPPPKYQFKFQNRSRTDFGRKADLLCPYYNQDSNQCSIWDFRGVVCTTYYCASSYGQDGIKFWQASSDYLSYVEMALAEDALVHLDFSPRDISDQLIYLNMKTWTAKEQEQDFLSPIKYKNFWNGYTSEIEFYKMCYDHARIMKRQDFKKLIGEQGLKLEKQTLERALSL